ncbi:MAG TPA: MEDS domain-containing protein [Nitrososphaeraceae archaeon]
MIKSKALRIIESKALDSAFFEQPLNSVHHVKEGQHIVLFHEEVEYAKMISFQFIKSGLAQKKECTYLSEEDVEAVKREMSDSEIDVDKFTLNGLLHVYQVPSLTDYRPRDFHIRENGLENTPSNFTGLGRSDRIVLRCIYKINTEEQIKSNLKWERQYRLKKLKNGVTTLLCVYPIDNIIPTMSDSTGAYGKWMNDLLAMYDGVIFARRFWKGVAFNLE